MKKALLVSMTIFTITTAYSQTEKGKKFIGGQISFNGNDNSYLDTINKREDHQFEIQIMPNYGYFIKDNLAVGANLNFGTSNSSSSDGNINYPPGTTSKSHSIIYGIGGFARYYKKITDNFLFFLNGGISYSYETGRLEQTSYTHPAPPVLEIQTNNISFGAYPGLVYFITPKLGIETGLGNLNYNISSSKNKTILNGNKTVSDNYGINLNTLSFGLSYYF